MIGQPMSVRVDDNITIKLGPFAREDMGEFIKNGRMQYHSISRYLSIHHALTIEDEQEWYDKTRKDKHLTRLGHLGRVRRDAKTHWQYRPD